LTRGQRAKAAVIAAVASPAIGLLCRTLKWRIDGDRHFDEIRRAGRQPILAVWHGRILPGLFHLRHRGIVVITSQNFDGEWIARILTRYGFGTARGSTSRGGARALVQLRRDLSDGRPVAFTVDGPRGPARVAQPGAVWLAGATGNPFSRVAIAFGPPLAVATNEPAEIDRMRVELETTLRALEDRTKAMLRNPR
jgi:lysophospholipid acyltransferase (LPLAT)-like uncharacterized protein